MSETTEEGKQNKRFNIKLIIIVSVVIGLIIASGFLTIDYYRAYRVIQLFSLENYDEASKLHDRYKDNSSYGIINYQDKIDEYMRNKALEIKNEYIDGVISFDEADKMIDKIEQYKQSNKTLIEIKEDMKSYYASREAYEDGNKYVDENNYILAINEYIKVIEQDISYYESAQDKIKNNIDKAKKECLKQVENFCNNREYNDAKNLLQTLPKLMVDDELKDKLTEVKNKQKEYHKKRTNEILSKLNRFEDPVDGTILYAPRPHKPTDFEIPRNGTIFYPLLSGKRFEGMIIRAGFNTESWVFMDNIRVNADDHIFDIKFNYFDRKSDLGFGVGLYEWVQIPVFSESSFDTLKSLDLPVGSLGDNPNLINDLEIVSNANDVKIKFSGSGGTHYYDLTAKDKENIDIVLELYNMQ